jgi:4-hydroxy-L-threonine phosphate dehydrogenase PdxA
MKKILVAISGLLLAAIVVVKVANAQSTPQEVKKVSTETKMDCAKTKASACCAKMKDSKSADAKVCDPSKCKEGKCDTSKCKAKCANMKTAMKDCDPAKCSGIAKK